MSTHEEHLFRQAMSGVKQLQQEARVWPVERKQGRPILDTGFEKTSPGNCAGSLRSDAPWVLKADGVSHEQQRRLSSGQLATDFELDLHGMTQEEACLALSNCLSTMLLNGGRVLSVIHGRGLHSKGGKPVLKKAAYDWFHHGPYAAWVLAVVPKPGTGGGSCKVLLRRSRE
ncbi:MAG: Smr/MutS family protein [Mariprofundaceae bacterium]